MMNADQRLLELFAQLTNYERTRMVEVEWSLDTMHRMVEVLCPGGEVRPAAARWVQVGGSKGKGTTVLYLESLARSVDLRTGVFTSPHLERVTERIRIDGAPVPAQALVATLEPILDAASKQALALSFFEAMTLAALVLFREEGVDLAVFEVGLGGRLDATTAVPVDASILTRVELEHVDLLGDTLAAIAAEKAFVMRPGKPVWFAHQEIVDAVFLAHALEVDADVRDPAQVVDAVASPQGWSGRLELGGAAAPFTLPAASAFELPALALAVACLRGCFPERPPCLSPVARPCLPGRFEVLAGADGWPTVLDGAHTPASASAVAAELQRRYPEQPVAALFATAPDKSWQDSLSSLLGVLTRVLVTTPTGIPGEDPAAVVAWLVARGVQAEAVGGVGDGLQELARCPAVRLVVGSFYLVGEARTALARQRGGGVADKPHPD